MKRLFYIFVQKTTVICLLLAGVHPLSSQTPTAGFATWKDNKKAAYSIIHDDFSNYVGGIFAHADPIATARGVKLCFGAITNYCGATEWANARTMIAHGHECVNHSHNHLCGGAGSACQGLSTYNASNFATELDLSTQLIETNTGVRPRFFIHPYDAPSDAILNHLQNNLGYLGTRAGAQLQANASNFTDFMRLNFFVYDGTESVTALNNVVQNAITSGGYAVREFHGIADGSWAAMTVPNYTSHLDFVKSKMDDGSLWSATTTEAITYKMQRDAYAPKAVYTAATNAIVVSFDALAPINTAVLTTPVTVNVNLNGLTGTFEASQNNNAVATTRTGDVISFNVYPHQGAVTLKCTNCGVTPPPSVLGCLKASYFANKTLSGTPGKVQAETKIDYNWGALAPLPGFPTGQFSIRWEGVVNPTVTGAYKFTVTADDGVRLWVDDKLVIDKWVVQSATSYSATVNLTQGQAAKIKMEYYEESGSAVAKLAWTLPGTTASAVIPFSACPIDPTPAPEFDPTKCYRLMARHSQKYFELTSTSTANNVVIQQDAWSTSRSKVWRLRNFDGTHYNIINAYSTKLVTVADASTKDGAKVVQFQLTSGDNQRFQLEKNTEGYYALIAKHSGKVLDVKDASTKNNADVIQWTKKGSTNQQWAIQEIGCPANIAALEDNGSVALTGSLDNDKAILQWIAPENLESDFFQIEKADETGTFQRLTIVNDTTGSLDIRVFDFSDEKLAEGDHFYRVKTVLKNGNAAYSDVVALHYAKTANYTVFPNPASDYLEIDLGKDANAVELSVYTLFGQLVHQQTAQATSKNQRIAVSHLAEGTYMLRIAQKGKRTEIRKFIVAH